MRVWANITTNCQYIFLPSTNMASIDELSNPVVTTEAPVAADPAIGVVEEAEAPETKRIKLENGKASATPEPKSAPEPPIHEVVGGSSVRQYLNKHLTQHLLEGLTQVNKTKPEDPLKALGEFLIKRSEELKKNGN